MILHLSSGTPLGGTWTGNGIPAGANNFIGYLSGAGLLHLLYV